MKAKLFLVILTLALATLTQAAVVPSASPNPEPQPTPIGPASSPQACADWCRFVYCAGGLTCGYYTVAGQPRCGCHDPSTLPGSEPSLIN